MSENIKIKVHDRYGPPTLVIDDGYSIKVISFDSREVVIDCVKELIKFCEIKQEELYPWIPCGEQMPEIGLNFNLDQSGPCVIGYENNGIIKPDLSRTYYRYRSKNGMWFWAENGNISDHWTRYDLTLSDAPTHWRSMPTL